MLELGRVCIPVGLACNLNCKYCYRNCGKTRINRLNDLMKKYLLQLNPEITRSVVISGGEPLLYFDRAKEIYQYVPDGVYKKIMTNGILLTQEIVDYCNINHIEIHVSHDGTNTKKLRGIDVLEDPKICDLIKQIQVLRIHSVICAGNEDICKNFEYIASKLNRRDFYYTISPVWGYESDELIKGFNYDLYQRSFFNYQRNIHRTLDYYKYGPTHSQGLNVLPDGQVCSLVTMDIYGTVENTLEEIIKKKRELGGFQNCENISCSIRDRCGYASQTSTPHLCKCLKINVNVNDYLRENSFE
nr:MAG TPA: Fe-S oxidoreductase [Caudoviricetes sp.]